MKKKERKKMSGLRKARLKNRQKTIGTRSSALASRTRKELGKISAERAKNFLLPPSIDG